MTRALRLVALAIAVAAFIDPPLTMTARGRARVALVAAGSTGAALVYVPAGSTPAGSAARNAAIPSDVRSALRADFDVVSGRDDSAAATIVVGDRYPAEPFPETARVFTVSTGAAPGERSPITAVDAPRRVPRGTLIHLEVDVERTDAGAPTSTLAVRAGVDGVQLATASHAWSAGERRWRASLDVAPSGQSPWALRVEVPSVSAAPGADGHAVDVLVEEAPPLRVLVHEARPSWTAAFVRRALERDPRFLVGSRVAPARGVQITAGPVEQLRADSLPDVQAIVVGGLDRLTAADAGVLVDFMRGRGGVVALLPDSRADARRIAGWFGLPEAGETLLDARTRLTMGAPLPALEATELLTFAPAAGDEALARTNAGAVVVVSPRGAGRLLVSGALDAWRFRANDNDAFDRFWQSAIAGLALDVPPAVDVRADPAVAAPGERVEVVVRVRRAASRIAADGTLWVSAAVSNGDPVRLWPAADPDTFHGSFAAAEGVTGVTATVPDTSDTSDTMRKTPAGATVSDVSDVSGSRSGRARILVTAGARHVQPSGPPLALLSQSRNGIDVAPARVADLTRALRDAIPAPSTRLERRPMRSLWWLLPFAACLSGEWWLRRRSGLR